MPIAAGVAILGLAIFAGRALRTKQRDARDQTAVSAVTEPMMRNSRRESAQLTRGELLYQANCAKCHGPDGHGDGEGAGQLLVRPRDFAGTRWRFAKDWETVRRVIVNGIPGSPMPAAKQAFSDGDLGELADHILLLGKLPPAPSLTAELDMTLTKIGFQSSPTRLAPDVSFAQTDGAAPIRLSQLKGAPVMLHFWGTSCAHCLLEMPNVVKVAESCETFGLKWISVCADEDDAGLVEKAARGRAEKHRLFTDDSGLAVPRFQVQVLPTFVLINANGELVGYRSGNWSGTVDDLRELCQHMK